MFSVLKSFIIRILSNKQRQSLQEIWFLYKIKKVKEPSFDLIGEIVKPGSTVLDLGANIGVYTKHMSQLVGPAGCVYSFEAVPTTFDLLDYIIKKLNIKNTILLNIAVNDKSGTVLMEIPHFQDGRESIYEARVVSTNLANPKFRQVSVKSETLDHLLLGKVKSLDFIKCDVEGNELSALKGAVGLIEKFKPIMYIEVSGNPDDVGSQAKEVFNFLFNYGYQAFSFEGKKLNLWKAGDQKVVDYFFLTKDQLTTFEATGKH